MIKDHLRNEILPWEGAQDWEISGSGHEASGAESSACFSPSAEHTKAYGDHPMI